MTEPEKKYRIELFSRRSLLGRRWYFRIVRIKGGKTVAPSEAYHNRGDCYDTARELRAGLFDAEIVNLG
jgi:hypothetical protein